MHVLRHLDRAGHERLAAAFALPAAGASDESTGLSRRALLQGAGGLVVMKRGTATVSAKEMADAVVSDHDTSPESWSQEGPPQGRRT